MQVLKVILLAVFGAAGVMVNIPQDQAVSNLSTWWVGFGLPPFDGILIPAVDSWVLAGCIAGGIILLVPWRRLMGYKSPAPKEVPTLDIPAPETWVSRAEADAMIRQSSLVRIPVDSIPVPQGQTIGGLLFALAGRRRTSRETKADELTRNIMFDFETECSQGVSDGQYGKELLEWWIDKKSATRS